MSPIPRQAASPDAPISRFYPVASPERLRDLCGPHHRNLQRFEARLDDHAVRLESQGGGIMIFGTAEGVSLAEAALAEFERRLLAGADAGDLDVDGSVAATLPGATAFSELGGLRKAVSAQTSGQAAYLAQLATPDHGLVFGVGPAGTGKTYLAVAAGTSALVQGTVDRLIVTRPAVEAGEKLGFLPGTLEEKVDPYMQPIWDSLRDFMRGDEIEKRMAGKAPTIEVAPLAFMRGRTLKKAFVVVDEAQNTSIAQMKMLLTRLGRGSRMVVTGDPGQVDLARGQTSGLAHALGILDGMDGVAVSRLTPADVVRHALVSRIIEAYGRDEAAQAAKTAPAK
ncbi:MAG: PhoH family protein [Pseudomonadota bacterium]